jgi:integrase/recombinase XerD
MTQEDSQTESGEKFPALFDLLEGTSEATRAKTAETFLELLGARVRNPNTRNAYRVAWRAFLAFCSVRQLELENVRAYHVGAWLDQHPGSRSTQRQHLAAVRLLFDSLMMRGVVEYNPAARARPPRLVRESSHTPVFEEPEIVAFLDSISSESLKDVRDKAIFSVLFYSWCRVSALINLTVTDYYERGGTRWLRFQEKRGKEHEVPVHSKAKEAVDLWLERSHLALNPSAPLFPSFGKNRETIESRRLDRRSVLKLVEKRARTSGILKRVCCHSFRATGVTEYMNSGGTIEIAQRIAGHTSPATTRIYDRSADRLTLEEIERVQIGKKRAI